MGEKNKLGTAVVTGASSGLGAVFADRLAARGYNLKLVARRKERLDKLAAQLKADYGISVSIIVADLALDADLQNVVGDLESDNSVTLLINNAGTSTLAPLAKTSVAKQRAMVDLNITAPMLLTKAVLPHLIERNEGIIINIASVLGFHTLPITSVYSGTKGFVIQYTRGLQEELKATNVRVQLVSPATTATELWDVAGVPLSALDPATIMKIEDCVDAALSGLDKGELTTYPSVNDQLIIDNYEDARIKLLKASQTGKVAERYQVT